jgi:hypothetical protein
MDNQTIGSEALVLYGEDDYIFVIEGIEDGLINFEYKQCGNIIGDTIIRYTDVPILNGSIAKIYVFKDYVDTTMYIDDDGDGDIDRKITPSNETRVNRPEKPSSPSGTKSGKTGIEYSYSTFSNDPEDDKIYYMFDWGDGSNSGWVGPFDSGDTVKVNNTWNVKGTYEIKVKAKDIYDYESEWSDPLPVKIPRTISINSLLLRLLERFPHAFPILRHLMGL